VLSDLIIHARYCRRIPVLTETAARQGDSSARVCGDNQKRYTPGFTALTERGVVPSWSLVRCDGGRNWILLQLITIIILRVLSGDPGRYGAATSRVFTIYEIF
ncbi:hypothetical protein ACCO22_RS23435, partial [Escherichia coli]